MAVAQHLPRGRHQAGDRHLKFHEDRDNLTRRAGSRQPPRALRPARAARHHLDPLAPRQLTHLPPDLLRVGRVDLRRRRVRERRLHRKPARALAGADADAVSVALVLPPPRRGHDGRGRKGGLRHLRNGETATCAAARDDASGVHSGPTPARVVPQLVTLPLALPASSCLRLRARNCGHRSLDRVRRRPKVVLGD